MTTPEMIKQWIEQGMTATAATVEGDGQHFSAVVVCPAFAGKTRLQQHRMVYDALGDKMKAEIHALSLRTLASEEDR